MCKLWHDIQVLTPFSVRGERKDVEGAEKHIKKLLKQFQEEGFQMEVSVFKELIRQIIGRQGAKLRQIGVDTSTRIRFPEEDSESCVFVLTGREKNCEAARDLILKLQNEISNISTEEIDIDSRFAKK